MTNNPTALDYKMSRATFDALLETKKKGEKKGNPYTYVMNLINREWGLRGTVKHLTIL